MIHWEWWLGKVTFSISEKRFSVPVTRFKSLIFLNMLQILQSFSLWACPCMGKKAMTRWSAALWLTRTWPITPSRAARGNLFPRTWRLSPIPRLASPSETWSASTTGSACTALPTGRASRCCRRNSPWKWGQVRALAYFPLGAGPSADRKRTSLFPVVHLSTVSRAAGSLIPPTWNNASCLWIPYSPGGQPMTAFSWVCLPEIGI